MTAENDTLQNVTEGSSAANLAHAVASASAISVRQDYSGDWSWSCSWCPGVGGSGLITEGAAESAAADHERAEHWR